MTLEIFELREFGRPDTRFDFPDDLQGIFRPRIVRGHDGQVAVSDCRFAHERPLPTVPVSTAAEHTHELAVCVFAQRL